MFVVVLSIMNFCYVVVGCRVCFFFKQKTAYEMRISDWSSDVCSSDLFTPMFIAVFCDETFKSVKKMGPFRRPGNKDVAAIRIIPLPAQIAESTQLVQGASNDGL